MRFLMYINSNYNIPFKSSILIEKGYCIETKQIKKYFLKSLRVFRIIVFIGEIPNKSITK